MYRGTTPTHIFTLPYDLGEISALSIAYEQGGNIILEKSMEDVLVNGNTISVVLSQEETLLFDSNMTASVQIRVRTGNGSALASKPITLDVGAILRDGVL